MGCTAITSRSASSTIAFGWVKTMVSEPEGHGLAVLEVAGTCAVIWILAYNQREKERVEGSLRQSERRFRALVQHASDIILVVASDGTVSYASPAFESVLGYSARESVGMLMNTIMDDRRRRPLRAPRLRHARPSRVGANGNPPAPPRRHLALVRGDVHQPVRRPRSRGLGRKPARHLRAQAVGRGAAPGARGVPPRVRRSRNRDDARGSLRSHHPLERGHGPHARLRRRRRARRDQRGRHHPSRRPAIHRATRQRRRSRRQRGIQHGEAAHPGRRRDRVGRARRSRR